MNLHCSRRALALWLTAIAVTSAQGQVTKPANTSVSSKPSVSTTGKCGDPGQKPCPTTDGNTVIGNCTSAACGLKLPDDWRTDLSRVLREKTWLAYPNKEQYLKSRNLKPTNKIKR